MMKEQKEIMYVVVGMRETQRLNRQQCEDLGCDNARVALSTDAQAFRPWCMWNNFRNNCRHL